MAILLYTHQFFIILLLLLVYNQWFVYTHMTPDMKNLPPSKPSSSHSHHTFLISKPIANVVETVTVNKVHLKPFDGKWEWRKAFLLSKIPGLQIHTIPNEVAMIHIQVSMLGTLAPLPGIHVAIQLLGEEITSSRLSSVTTLLNDLLGGFRCISCSEPLLNLTRALPIISPFNEATYMYLYSSLPSINYPYPNSAIGSVISRKYNHSRINLVSVDVTSTHAEVAVEVEVRAKDGIIKIEKGEKEKTVAVELIRPMTNGNVEGKKVMLGEVEDRVRDFHEVLFPDLVLPQELSTHKTILDPSGHTFHPRLTTTIHLEPLPAHHSTARCSLIALYTIPSTAIIDPYQLSELIDPPEFYGEIELEAPLERLRSWGALVFFQPKVESDITVPMHMRYQAPRDGNHNVNATIPKPLVGYSCTLPRGDYSYERRTRRLPLPISFLLEYTGTTYFVPFQDIGPDLIVSVPVGRNEEKDWVGWGTRAIVFAGLAWIVGVVVSEVRRRWRWEAKGKMKKDD